MLFRALRRLGGEGYLGAFLVARAAMECRLRAGTAACVPQVLHVLRFLLVARFRNCPRDPRLAYGFRHCSYYPGFL